MRDVIIIGGGPAGSSLGTLLAKLGYDVLLLEKERFPRHHIGESTLPSTLDALEITGVLDEVRAAGFPVKRGGVYVWGKNREPWRFYFGEVNIGTALQVERGRFDQILLQHASRTGVEVREQHRVTGWIEKEGRIAGVHYLDREGRRHSARSRMVVDASGQSAFLSSRRRTRRFNEGLKNVAIYGYWQGPRALEVQDVCTAGTPEDRNSIFIETIPHGWCWWLPLEEAYFSVGAVAGREAIDKLKPANLREFYLERVRETAHIQRFVAHSELRDPIRSIRDWSSRTSEYGGPGFLLVGDAAAFVDPILSTGIFLAVNFAMAATKVIHTIFSQGLSESLCLDWYQSIYNAVYEDYESMAQHWYYGERTQDSWFWRARRAMDAESQASFREAFVLMASGRSHSIFNNFVSPACDGVTYFSDITSMGCMSHDYALRRVAANLELDLPTRASASPEENGTRLVLTPRRDWTLGYALIRPDGTGHYVSPDEARRLGARI